MQAHAEGTMTRRLHGGKAAEVGVVAALLARRGFTGPTEIVEGRYGFFKVYATASDAAAVTADLGSRLMIEDAWLKYYPVNGLFQAPIDAARSLQAEHGFTAADVVEVRATIARASRMHAENVHTSSVRAQFSLPVCLALRDGRPRPQALLSAVTDPEVLRLAERVHVTLDARIPEGHPDATRFGRVEVALRTGQVVHREVLYPRGHPKNPMGWEDVRRKFDELLDGWVGPAHRDALAERLAAFDRLDDTSTLDLGVRTESG
jgi:2-methylcitrate dehydratase PrpD